MTRPLTADMQAVIADAYQVFSRYRLHAPLIVCRCNVCVGDEETFRALSFTPLQTMSSQLLAEYTNSAHGDEGSVVHEQLRYFLPRYFELIAAGDVPSHLGLEFCLRRLGGMPWRAEWPADERDVIERFFDRVMIESASDYSLNTYGGTPFLDGKIDAVLIMIVQAGGDVRRALACLASVPDPDAGIQIAALRMRTRWNGHEPFLASECLSGHQDGARAIGMFANDAAQTARIEMACLTSASPAMQTFLSAMLS